MDKKIEEMSDMDSVRMLKKTLKQDERVFELFMALLNADLKGHSHYCDKADKAQYNL
ncbi:MAG: hypothetical protein ACK5MR_05135 [Cumulibacter sp.]